MSVDVQTCTSCTSTWFPHRLLCPACGGSTFLVTAVDDGVLEEATTVGHDLEIGTLRLSLGPRVVARLHGTVSRGATVPLTHDPHDARRPVAHVPAPSTPERNTDV